MIHQLIFAHPKPGMSEQDFLRYWKETHAPIASKIPQFKSYLIDSRIPFGTEPQDPPFSGVAEIWFENEQEQLKSAQSKEFIEGARRDEPNWAAFWQTFALDTTSHEIKAGEQSTKNPTWVKMLILLKRRPGMSLADFRKYWLETHGPLVMKLPGLRRYLQCHVNDAMYALGESKFDGVEQIWFDNTQALSQMMDSAEYKNIVKPDLESFVDPKYIFTLVTEEYWVMEPESRKETTTSTNKTITTMPKQDVINFLRAVKSDTALKEKLQVLTRPEVTEQAKKLGYNFAESELNDVVWNLEMKIAEKRGEKVDAQFSMWPEMWGRYYFAYAIDKVFGGLSEQDIQEFLLTAA